MCTHDSLFQQIKIINADCLSAIARNRQTVVLFLLTAVLGGSACPASAQYANTKADQNVLNNTRIKQIQHSEALSKTELEILSRKMADRLPTTLEKLKPASNISDLLILKNTIQTLDEIKIEATNEPEDYVRPQVTPISKLRNVLEKSERLRFQTINEGQSSGGTRTACISKAGKTDCYKSEPGRIDFVTGEFVKGVPLSR